MFGGASELRDGVDPIKLVHDLTLLIGQAQNSLGGTSLDRTRDAYLQWADGAERVLSHSFADPLVPLGIASQRHWQIRDLTNESPWSHPVIATEIAFQTRKLQSLIDSIQRKQRAFGTDPGLIAVLDTNVILQHRPIGGLPWTTILKASKVRLIIPLRVIQELDQKKWSESDKLRKRARGIVPDLARLLLDGQISPEVTVQVPVLGELTGALDADEDILATCVEIGRFCDNELRLVTADLGMTQRARALDLAVTEMPANTRRVPDEPLTKADGS